MGWGRLAGVLIFAVVLGACSGGGEDATQPPPPSSSAPTTASTTTTTTLPVETTSSAPRADIPVEPVPTNAPVLPSFPPPVTIEVDFDEAPGTSADERRRLEALRSSVPVVSVFEVGRSSGGLLSPDGTRLALVETDQLCVVTLADGEKTCTAFGDEYAGATAARSDLSLVWSPDSRRIAVAVPTSIWRDAVWVFEVARSLFIPVVDDGEWNGRQTLLAWIASTDQILVLRTPPNRSEPGDVVLVGTDSVIATLYPFAESSLLYQIRSGSFSAERGLVLFADRTGAVRLTRTGVDVLTEADERGFTPSAIAITNDASTVAFVSRNDIGFRQVDGPSFIVDTETRSAFELPGEPDHIMFDPTSTWVATVSDDTSIDPTTYVVRVAPISDPAAGVEVFRSNRDEFFARTDRDGRREPGASPPAPPPIWSDQDTLLIPLTQQGSILVIDLVGL